MKRYKITVILDCEEKGKVFEIISNNLQDMLDILINELVNSDSNLYIDTFDYNDIKDSLTEKEKLYCGGKQDYYINLNHFDIKIL